MCLPAAEVCPTPLVMRILPLLNMGRAPGRIDSDRAKARRVVYWVMPSFLQPSAYSPVQISSGVC